MVAAVGAPSGHLGLSIDYVSRLHYTDHSASLVIVVAMQQPLPKY